VAKEHDLWKIAPHRFYDLHAVEVAACVAEALGAPAVLGGVSRLWVDLNRAPSDPDLIPVEVDGVSVPFNRGVGSRERAARIATVHTPFHRAVDQAVEANSRTLRALISIHSFTRRIAAETRERDFSLGILHDGRSRLAKQLGEELRARGRKPRDNEPYSGFDGKIYSVARHGQRWRLPYAEIEIRDDCTSRDLVLDLIWALRRVVSRITPSGRD
jgi:predicted N-formylglutamate amidohydrolase